MSTISTPTGGIKEYFLLADARATAKRIPEDARTDLARTIGIGRQRAEAADALWSNGHTAEGLRLASEAFEATLEAVPRFADASGLEVGRDADIGPLKAGAPRALAETELAETDLAGEADLASAPTTEAEAGEAADDEDAGELAQARAEAKAAEADAAAEAAADDDAGELAQARAEAKAAEADAAAEAAADEADAGASDAHVDAERRDGAVSGRADAARARRAEPGATHAPSWVAVLRARGVSEGKIADVIETDNALRASTLPSLDDEVTAAHGELFQRLVSTRRHVERAIVPAAMTPGQIAWTQASRVGFAALLLAAVAVGVYFLVRTPEGVDARASARFGAEFEPENVIDEDPATEWLLPDRTAGWVEVSISPPQPIEQIRLLNSHNRQYNDRATREYTVELYADDEVLHTLEGSWDELLPRPTWTEHEVSLDEVDRIRFNARSWHQNGAGLAELDWE